MSSRITMILALLFLFGALLAGYWGLVLSRSADAPATAAVATVQAPAQAAPEPDSGALRQPVLVLRRDVAAYTPLTAEDVGVEQLRVAPAGSLQRPEQVVGRSSWRALAAGSWLEDSSFEAGGPLARMIQPGERALAVAVDEVVGAAGQLRPGDYVDVLLYLREDNANPQASAQVALPALRLLSVGEQLGLGSDGQPVEATVDAKAAQEQRRVMARTVVLAVPEALASRLLLAAQAGSLRLAVRSAQEQRLARYWADPQAAVPALENANRDLFRFSQLAMAPAGAAPVSAAPAHAMQIIRGPQAAPPTP